MQARFVVASAFVTLVIWVNGCSSGLGNNLPSTPPAATIASDNLPVGLDLGVAPSDAPSELAIAGFTVPAYGSLPARDLVLLAFTSAAAADNASGAIGGAPLARDPAADTNGASDVFVAAVSAQDIETRAFSQALAGKFRHPRCTTCHSMQAPTTQAFASSPLPHAGPPPGPAFPNNDPTTCAPCHANSTAFPVASWQAPAASFDLRNDTVAQLAARAALVPAGDLEHFVGDARVLWALDSGVLPTVGGRNGIADDDHDGVAEPEDEDGVIRTVPGGSAAFIRQIEEWNASGRVVTAAGAVRDVTLVSRATTGAAANGASRRAQLLFVANPGFDPTSAATAAASNPVGTLFVAFESDGTDLAAGDGNAVTDVYRARIDVRVEEDAVGAALAGGINLVWQNSTLLVSARDGLAVAGDAASTRPTIGGANGQLIAFASAASDLIAGFTDGNGAGTDVFVRRIGVDSTVLVSHTIGNVATGGDGASERPAIDATGVAVAFESDATDLIASDLNALRDVFHARIDAGAPFLKVRASVSDGGAEAAGGASSAPSIFANATDVLVAFQSDATNLAAGLVAPTNVYLFASATGTTTLLNQRIAATGSAIGNGSATAPVLANDGSRVVFASASDNIDVLRTSDGNRATDLFLVEVAQLAAGNVLPFRVSTTVGESADANGASSGPVLTASTSATFPSGYLAYTTAATNLGTADTTNVMVSFLAETSGVFADFTASVARGIAPLQVVFSDASSGAPTTWQWDFDNDGTVDSTEQNPTFVYTAPGTYTVRLTASNGVSEGTKTATDFVIAVTVPDADFTIAPPSGAAPLLVTFTDTSTQSPTSWQWDFTNDGVIDSTAQNPSFNYPTPGTFDVRLVATNEAGSATETKVGAVQVFAPVVASFTTSVSSGPAPLSVTFTNTSTGAVSFDWDFGDGNFSTAASPTHVFVGGGTPTVTLTATGPGGVDTATTQITVNSSASFTMTVGGNPITSAYESTAITFTSTSTGSPTSFAWDFDFIANPGVATATGSPVIRNFLASTTSTRVFVVRLSVNGPGGPASVQQNLTIVSDTETIDIGASADNTIYSNNTNNSNGAGVNMVTGTADINGPRRALLRFATSGIPTGSTIGSATLQLTHTSPQGPTQLTGTRVVSMHRATAAWTEGTSNNASSGIGAAAAGGGATWANRVTGPATAWTSQGGDFVGAATGTMSVNDAPGLYASTDLATDVQAWLDGSASNFGWVLVGDEGAGKRIKWFATRENATAASRPNLRVVYTRPLP